MATYLSTPYQGSKYIPTVPLDIIAQGLQIKQKGTDEFRAHNQGILDELGKNTFYRDADLSYVNNKIKDAVNSMNEYGGQDLLDGNVQTQINGIMNGITGDPEVTKRIIANKQRAKTVNDMLEIKEKHPEMWNMQNYLDWKTQDDEWKSDPEKIDYNASFQPYVDTHKYDEEAQKDILSNPITRSEIDYYVDGNGVKHRRGEKEVAEVTKDRLKSAMISGMPDNVKGQHQLEYRNAIRSTTPEQAAKMVENEVSTYQSILDGFNDICADPKATPEQRQQANELSLKAEQAIKVGKQTMNDILAGKKPVSDVLTFEKYVDTKYDRIASSHAYHKDGPYKYDDLYMEGVKSSHARDLERLKASLKMQETAPAPLNNDFVNGTVGALLNKVATVNANTMADLIGVTGKQDDQGYYNLPMNGTEIQLNTTPIMQTFMPQADNRKVAGLQRIKEGYAAYKLAHPAGVASSAGPRPSDMAPNGGYWSSTLPPELQQQHTTVSTEPTFDEYLNIVKGDATQVDAFKKNYGIDLNNAADIQDSKKAQIELSKKVGDNQAFRFNKGAGNLRITTTVNGGNLFRGDDGELHVATTAVGTWNEITSALGYDPSNLQGKPGSPNLIMPTGQNDKGTDKQLYSFPVILKVNGDILSKFNDNLSNHSGLGAGELKDNRGTYTSEYAKKLANARVISSLGYQDIPTPALRENMVKKVQEVVPVAQQKQYVEAIDSYISTLNANPSDDVKQMIYGQIYNLMQTQKSGTKK